MFALSFEYLDIAVAHRPSDNDCICNMSRFSCFLGLSYIETHARVYVTKYRTEIELCGTTLTLTLEIRHGGSYRGGLILGLQLNLSTSS